MPRRILLLLLAGLALTLYLVPQLPGVRAWALRQAEPYAARAGYAVSYAASRGNLWRGVTLLDAQVSGPGLELAAERLGVRYTLGALLTGRLPLAIAATGVRGSFDAQTLLDQSEGGGAGVRVVVRSLELEDARIALTRLPYTLPDLTLTDLGARSVPGGLQLTATVATAEGTAEVEGELSLDPFAFRGRVPRAEVAIARHWWPGLEGGVVSGTVTVAEGRVAADAVVEDGSLSFLGARVTAIEGPVTYRHPRIDAELTGQALGGELTVRGGVEVAERRWFGDARGQLEASDVALWLAQLGGAELERLPLTGRVTVDFSASGWDTFRLTGDVQGDGQVAGYPLEDLTAHVDLTSGTGPHAELAARLAGGPVTAELRPTPNGSALEVRGQDLALAPDLLADATLFLETGGGLRGAGGVRVAGDLLGRGLELALDLTVEEGAYRLDAAGAALGGQLAGEAVWRGAELVGSATVEGVELPGMARPLTLALSAQGPPTALELSGRVTGGPLELEQGPLRARLPVAGEARAKLADGRLQGIILELSGVRATGDLALAPLAGELRYDLGPLTLAGGARGTLALADGTLRLTAGGFSGDATLRAEGVELPGAALGALAGTLRYSLGQTPGSDSSGGVRLAFSDPRGMGLIVADGRLRADLDAFTLQLAGRDTALTGHAEAAAADPLGTLQLDLTALSAGVSARLTGPADALAVTLSAPELDARLAGRADLLEPGLALSGDLAGYSLALTATLQDGVARADAELSVAGETFTVSLVGPPFAPDLGAEGRLDLGPLARRFGVPLTGTLAGTLRRAARGADAQGTFAGALTFAGHLLEQPLELTIAGVPDGLTLTGEAQAWGQALALSGALLPDLRLTVTGEPGRLEYAQGRVTGGGRLPALDLAGLRVEPQEWTLLGDTNALTVTLSPGSGESVLTLQRQAGTWRLAGTLEQRARWREAALELSARLAWSSAQPHGEVTGEVTLRAPVSGGVSGGASEGADAATLELTGDLTALRLTGTLDAALLAAAAALPVTPAGEVALDLDAHLRSESSRESSRESNGEPSGGPTYTAQASWRAGDEVLELRATGMGDAFTVSASGAGLRASYQDGALRLDAQGFPLSPWLAAPAVAGSVTGTLNHTPDTWWQGELRADLTDPVTAALTLTGDGDALRLQSTATPFGQHAGAELRAAGTLLPQLALELNGTYRDLVRVSGEVAGQLTAPTLTLALTSRPFALPQARLELPAFTWRLEAALGETGVAARLEDEAGNALTLAGGQLAGGLAAPFSLADEGHRLEIAASGTPTDPALALTVAGPRLTSAGRVTPAGFGAELALEPFPPLPALPNTLTLARAGLTLSGTLTGGPRWRGTLTAAGEAASVPARLTLDLEGVGLAYQGAGALELAGEPVALAVAGEGTRAEVDAELAGFDLAALPLPVEVTGEAAGTVSVSTSATTSAATSVTDPDASPLRLELAASGTALGQPFALELRQRPGEPLKLDLAALGGALALRRDGAGYALDATFGDAETGLELAGRLNLGAGLELAGSGRWRGEPLTVTADARPASGLRWTLMLGAASWRGALTPTPTSSAFTSTVDIPAGSSLPVTGHLDVAGVQRDGVVTLERAVGALSVAGETLALELAGRAWPVPALGGTLTSERFGAFDLALGAPGAPEREAAYRLTLAQPGLEVALGLSRAFAPRSASFTTTTGAPDAVAYTTLPVGPGIDVAGALTWSADEGFGGEAELRVQQGDLALQGRAVGRGGIELTTAARWRGAPVGEAEARLGPDPLTDPSLAGSIRPRLELATLWPSYTGAPLTLTGDLALGGTPAVPTLAGPVEVTGALDAEGTARYQEGAGTLTLRGDGLELTGTLSATGAQTRLSAEALPIAALLPQVADPHLSLDARAEVGWGAPPTWRAERIELTLPASRLTGELRARSAQLAGQLRLDVALADVRVGPELVGRVKGSISVSEASSSEASSSERTRESSSERTRESLSEASSGGVSVATTLDGATRLGGVLDAQAVGVAGTPGRLSGNVFLGGSLEQPSLTARLRADEGATGTLVAVVEPAAGRYLLSSTLALGELTSDVRLDVEGEALSASGALRYRDFAFVVAEADRDHLRLEGRERLAGWRLDAELTGARATLTGPLASLAPELGGALELRADWSEALTLSGALRDAEAFGVSVGTLELTPAPGAPWRLELAGEALAATLDLAGGPSWTLERLTLRVADALTLSAKGEGALDRARLELTAAGEAASVRYRVPLTATYQEGRLELAASGTVADGDLALLATASPEAGWRGRVTLSDAAVGGAALAVEGDLTGAWSAPRLVAETRVSANGAALVGTFTAGLADGAPTATLDATLSAPFARPLTVQGTLWPSPALTLRDAEGSALTLAAAADGVVAEGAAALAAGPLHLVARGEADGLELVITAPPVPGLELRAALGAAELAAPAALLARGLTFVGTGDTSGSLTLRLDDGLTLSLDDLGVAAPVGTLTLTGELSSRGGLHGTLTGAFQSDAPPAALPWLTAASQLALELTLTPTGPRLKARGGGAVVEGSYDWQRGGGSLVAAVVTSQGGSSERADVNLTFQPERGPSGTLTFSDFPAFATDALGVARLQGELTVTPKAVTGEVSVRLPEGSLTAAGRLGLAVLPLALAPLGEAGSQLTLESETFDPSTLPFVRDVAPYLSAPLSGSVSVRDGQLSGELTSEALRVAERELPLTLALSGTLAAPTLEGTLSGSRFEVSAGGEGIEGLVRFERFPVETLVEAWLGPTDVRTSLTGALRFALPTNGAWGALELRFASERFTLERDGIVTEGELSFTVQEGGLTLQRAEFVGAGSWRASGEASLDALNLRFEAEEADFSPLLGLVPQLAGLGVGAFGSAELVTTGSLRQPTVRLSSPALELQLAGTRYLVRDATFSLQDGDFVTAAQVEAAAPLSGVLRLSGGGRLTLAPERTFDATLRFTGATALPVVGTIDGVNGTIDVQPGEPWRLNLSGALGAPFTLSGTLAPLDLTLTGERLDLKAPAYFLAGSETDVELRFFRQEAFHLAGSLFVHQAQIALRRATGAAPDVAQEKSSQAEPTPAPSSAALRARNPVLASIRFDDVRIVAPQQITFQENFGAAELKADLTLAGTALTPTLSGSAESIRGSVRFAGRDFTLQEAIATFEPSRGVYPAFRIVASTTFDKAEVERTAERARTAANGSAADLVFLAPSGPTFSVILTISGEVQPASGPQPYTLDVTTTLSSDAEIQEDGVGVPRSLTEPELLSLLTLGRLELSSVFATQDGLATSLAQGAVDTAVDYFILSEVQRQLAEALGVDVLEIRTTTLGSLLSGEGAESFGVSLRIGGYLTDELFASYQIGSLGLAEDVALRNEFNVRYDLYPLEFTLLGSLDVLRTPGLTPTPRFGLNLSYAFTPLIRLQAGVSVSSTNQSLNFGVNFRW